MLVLLQQGALIAAAAWGEAASFLVAAAVAVAANLLRNKLPLQLPLLLKRYSGTQEVAAQILNKFMIC